LSSGKRGSSSFNPAISGQCSCYIIGYGGRYDRCLFVIYDLGFIRDTAQFSHDIEANPNVHVLIVKR
jgi:hypothetical protein